MNQLNSLNEILSCRTIFIDKSELFARLEKCKACEYLTDRAGINICSECGCVIKLKARLAAAKCPSGKWLAVETS